MTGLKRSRFSLKYISALLLLTAGIVFTGSALVSMSYEKAIVRYLKGYLEEHLLTRLSMDENIRFRFFRGFPNTTIEVKNVLLLSGADFARGDFGHSYADTLLHAQSAYLRFNPFKILRKKYDLKKIEISHGTINILFDKQNRNNLKIWKSDKAAAPGYTINLKNIVISDTRIRIRSLSNALDFDGRSVKTNFRGNLATNVLSGDTKGHFRISKFTLKEKNIAHSANLQLDISMIYSGDRFRVSGGTVRLNKATAHISGEYKAGEKSTIDLSLEIPKFGLNELMSIIPVNTFKSVNYEFDGTGNLNLQVKGPLDNIDQLMVSSAFVLSNCTAKNRDTRSSFTNINVSGRISGTSAPNFNLQVDTFHASMGKGSINGSLSVSDLNKLSFRSAMSAEVDLKELTRFAGVDSLQVSGFVRSTFTAAGNLKKVTFGEALNAIQTGVFEFENANIRYGGLPVVVQNISGRAILGTTVKLDSITLRLNETNLMVSGEIRDLGPYLSKSAQLKPDLSITCDILDISKYLNKEIESSNTGFKSLSVFPGRIYARAKVHSGKFIAGKFEATDVSVSLSAVRDSLFLDHFRLSFPDGSISGTAIIRSDGSNYSVTCNAVPEKINIRQLFSVFNNFGQHFILDKNLKGDLAGSVNFYAQWDSALKIIPASVKASGEIQISNGELVQFEPMLKLSKYIDVDELRHIRFSTLNNSIYISDRMVNIPEMNINSSAFNISVAGQHSFDNAFDYRLRVLLSEVLFNKARKKKKEINEFFIEETPADQTTIPLIIAGIPSDFDVKFDRKKAFSLTRKINSTSQPGPNPNNFKVEWEEPADVPVEKPEKETDQSDFVIEWEE
jgi:hypothetical protein